MSRDKDEVSNYREEYKTITNNLQNYMLIFLSFLFFVTFFILNPYYFVADSYKSARNVQFLTGETNKNLSSIQVNLRDLAKNPNYQNALNEINAIFTAQYMNLSQARKSCGNIAISSPDSDIKKENMTSSQSDDCSVIDTKIANLSENRNNQLNEKIITINTSSLKSIRDKIPPLLKMVKEISENNTKYKAINDSILVSVKNWINNLDSNLSEFKSPDTTSNISLAELQKYIFITANAISPIVYHDEQLQSLTSSFYQDLKSIKFPIIGQLPYLRIDQLLLSFPVVIVVGFSFISLQYRNLIQGHKKFGDKFTGVRSWVDPVQESPGNIYALIIMALPAILYLVFIFLMNIILNTNIHYPQDSTLVTEDLLIIPENIKNILQTFNIIGFAALISSYYQLIREWRKPTNNFQK